jgi:hypothetical protein
MLIAAWVVFPATVTWMVAVPELPVSMDGITETSMRVGVPPEAGETVIHGGAGVPAVPPSMLVVNATALALVDTMETAWGSGVSPPVIAVKVSARGETCNNGVPAPNVTLYVLDAVKPRWSTTWTVKL